MMKYRPCFQNIVTLMRFLVCIMSAAPLECFIDDFYRFENMFSIDYIQCWSMNWMLLQLSSRTHVVEGTSVATPWVLLPQRVHLQASHAAPHASLAGQTRTRYSITCCRLFRTRKWCTWRGRYCTYRLGGRKMRLRVSLFLWKKVMPQS